VIILEDETTVQRAALKELALEVHSIAAEFSNGHDYAGRPSSRASLVSHTAMAQMLRRLADRMDALAAGGTPSALAGFFGTLN
jgi:hypothetical protein